MPGKADQEHSAAIDGLLAKQEIRDVLMRYCRGVDRVDLELIRSCYHSDAWDDHGSYRGNVDGLLDEIRVDMPKTVVTHHFLGNSLIEVEGDRAESETYIVAFHRLPARGDRPETDLTVAARYLDVFERRAGGPWLIARRTVVHSWNRLDLVGATWPGSSAFVQPRREDRTDLVYHLSDDAGTPRER